MPHFRKQLFCYTLLIFSSLLSVAQSPPFSGFSYQIKKQAVFQQAAVVSSHALASEAGLKMLQLGGNAIDAAIATQWALAVVYPNAGNIGGGGFMVARLSNGKTIALDYREKAPEKATADMFLDKKTGNPKPGLSLNGHLAAGVPGTVSGLFSALKYARLPMKILIQPAIELAKKGFVLTAREADSLNNTRNAFEKVNTTLPVFVKQSGHWKAGDTLVQKDLAATLTRIKELGPKGFYEGLTAALIVQEMERGAGIISLNDLKNYQAKEREPMRFAYKGYQMITMPLPSSGGILLQQMLGMLEHRPVKTYGFQSVKAVQLITEVERRAYADRAEWLGDEDFIKVPVKTLVSKVYLDKRMEDYDSTSPSASTHIKAGEMHESDQTTHLSVMDKEGNAVSVTTTLNESYGCKTVVAGAGFLLNNEMDDFSSKPGTPNTYGAIGGYANAIAPAKRMLSSMTPTIVLKNNKPFMIVGTPGGTTITTSVLQSIINVIDYNMNADDAVNSPKFHHQWQPDYIRVEASFPMVIRSKLETMGYTIKEREDIGRTEMILIRKPGKIEAVADNRGDDSVAGW